MSDNTNETPVTENTSEAPAEAPVAEAITLDSLTAEDLGEAFGTTHKGINRSEVMGSLNDDARKLVAGFQADYTRKNQELSAARKALEEERSQMRSMLSAEVESSLRKQMAVPENVDLKSPEGMQAYINAQVAAKLNETLEPQRQQMRATQRRAAVETFVNNTPDFDTYKDAVIDAMKTKNLGMEDAYVYAKGQAASGLIAEREAELARYKQAAKENGLKVSTGRKAGKMAKPKFKSALEAYEWREQMKAEGKL